MLTLKTLRGASWSVAARMSSRVIDLATLLLLAQVLTPADFGLMAIAVSLISIVEMIFEMPLVQALLRLSKIEKSHLDTAFTLGLLRGGAIALLMTVAAWPIANLYQDSRFTILIPVLAIGPVARSLYSPTMVNFYRELDYRVSFIIDLSGKITAAIFSIVILYAGGGYWALVLNSVMSSVMPTILSYMLSPYRPHLSIEKIHDFSAFTGWFASSQILAAMSWQYDRIFLGYHVDKAVLGRYSLASDFAVMPTQSLIGPAMRPVMAAFSSMADDRRRLHLAFLKAAKLTMLIALPAGVGIALTSDQIVSILLGPQWISSVSYLQLLSLAIAFTAYYQPVNSLCLAMNKPNLLLEINLFEAVIKIALMTIAFYVGGVLLMLYARVLGAIFQFFISAIYAQRVIGVSILVQLKNLWQVGISCVFMAISIMILRETLKYYNIGPINSLIVIVLSGILLYGIGMRILGFRLQNLLR